MRVLRQVLTAGLVIGVAATCVDETTAPRSRLILHGLNSVTTPSSARVAFSSDRDGVGAIYIMNSDGSAITRLTHGTGEFAPAWSPDGRRIAFVGTRDGNTEIYVVDVDGSNEMRLTNDPAADADPTWSPDGSRIAFQSFRDGNYEIYVVNADGSGGLTRLTNDPGADWMPDWGPDGRIAFSSAKSGRGGDIWVMSGDGSGQTPITTGASAFKPRWSYDGSRLLFISTRFRQGRPLGQEIYVVNADGSGETLLTDTPGLEISEDWSPDAQRIVYSRRDGDQDQHLFVMNADGTGSVRVTSDVAVEQDPAWETIPASPPIDKLTTLEGSIVSVNAASLDIGPGQPDFQFSCTYPLAFDKIEGTVTVPGRPDLAGRILGRIAVSDPSVPGPGLEYVPFTGQVGISFNDGSLWQGFVLTMRDGDGDFVPPQRTCAIDGSVMHISIDGLVEWVLTDVEDHLASAGPAVISGSLAVTPEGVASSFNFSLQFLSFHDPGSIALGRATEVGYVGESQTLTATVREFAGAPPAAVQSATVRFSAEGITPSQGECTTDAAGQCGFTYSRATPGPDDIAAFVDVNNDGLLSPGEPSTRVSTTWGLRNRPPVLLPGGPYTGIEGTPLTLGASATDQDGDALSYSWNFGDGASGTGNSLPASHTYADNGTYTLRFSVDDGKGGSDAKSATVSIENFAPSVHAPTSATVVSGTLFSFSGGFTDRGVNDNPWTWSLSWGEGAPAGGTTSNQTASIEAQHQYLRAGSYVVQLSVADKNGAAGTASTLVTVVRQTVGLAAIPFISGRTPFVYYNVKKPALSEPLIIAILGSPDFTPVDPTTKRPVIDLASTRIGTVGVANLNGIYAAGPLDVNGDGRLDLLLTFQTDKLVQAGSLNPSLSTPQSLTLLGNHLDGRQFGGTQQIVVATKR